MCKKISTEQHKSLAWGEGVFLLASCKLINKARTQTFLLAITVVSNTKHLLHGLESFSKYVRKIFKISYPLICTHTCACRKFCVRTKWMIPLQISKGFCTSKLTFDRMNISGRQLPYNKTKKVSTFS